MQVQLVLVYYNCAHGARADTILLTAGNTVAVYTQAAAQSLESAVIVGRA